jgi:hypothetical protein
MVSNNPPQQPARMTSAMIVDDMKTLGQWPAPSLAPVMGAIGHHERPPVNHGAALP